AVVGFDDIALAELVSPALTTVHVDRHQLGKMASELLLQRMDDPTDDMSPLQLATTLVIRDSCGATLTV
ncbi:MAG: substrate-binding domain-containing protein, partial [Caldilineaceae bacterium]|nr:substrate-binding domain-containing protein [Caldilineaceae bacterium]